MSSRQRQTLPPTTSGKCEIDHVMVRVQHQQRRRVHRRALDAAGLRAAVQQHAEAARVGILPLVILDVLAGRRQPADIAHIQFGIILAGQEARAAQDWEGLPQYDDFANKFRQFDFLFAEIPVRPN